MLASTQAPTINGFPSPVPDVAGCGNKDLTQPEVGMHSKQSAQSASQVASSELISAPYTP